MDLFLKSPNFPPEVNLAPKSWLQNFSTAVTSTTSATSFPTTTAATASLTRATAAETTTFAPSDNFGSFSLHSPLSAESYFSDEKIW